MSEEFKVIYNKEYSVTVEDAMVRVIVSEGYIPFRDHQPLSNLHSHSHTELFVCTCGSITIKTEYGDVRLDANDAVIIPSFMTHTKLDLPTPAEWQSVSFSLHKRATPEKTNFYKILYNLCSSKEAIVLKNRSELCDAVMKLTKAPNIFLPLPALRMCLCLAEIADTYKSDKSPAELREPTPVDINHATRLELLVEAYYPEALSSDLYAKLMCVSKRQLSRIVQKRYGTTLRNVILQKRLSVAAVMLENTQISVQEISNKIGFGDVNVFRREFKNFYKMSPSEYRSRNSTPTNKENDKRD